MVVAVVVAVCATVGRGCMDAGTASGPGAIAGSISTPVGEWSQGQVPRLYQTDPAWAGAPYAGSTVEEAGCGPTCLAMVYVSITGKKITTLHPCARSASARATFPAAKRPGCS